MAQYGEHREKEGYYIAFFLIENERAVKAAIKKEQAKSGEAKEKARHKSISEMIDEFWNKRIQEQKNEYNRNSNACNHGIDCSGALQKGKRIKMKTETWATVGKILAIFWIVNIVYALYKRYNK